MSLLTQPLLEGLQRLSPPQREAVFHGEGPLLVVAGAGSGKTRVLTYRAARLIQDGVPPEKILMVTFTNRAAAEFRERLEKLLGPASRDIWTTTLHSAGRRILRLFGNNGSFNPNFRVADEKMSISIIMQAVYALEIPKEDCLAPQVLSQIAFWKERLMTLDDIWEQVSYRGTDFERNCARIFGRYEQMLKAKKMMDFSDLVVNTVRLLEPRPELARRLGLQHILVDEYQDTDPAQSRMLDALLPPSRNLTAVGDCDQAIYGFRGAEPELMLRFAERYPGARVVPLGQNYRSSQTIVAAATAVIEKNQKRIPHRIWSENREGYPVVLIPAENPAEEASQVAARIETLVRSTGIPYSDIAILYRTNFQSEPLEAALVQAGIPHHVVGTRFFDRQEIKDAIAYLRLVANPDDWESMKRIANRPARCMTRDTLVALENRCKTARCGPWAALATAEQLVLDQKLLPERNREACARFYALIQELRNDFAVLGLPELARNVILKTGLREYYGRKDGEGRRAAGTTPSVNLERLVTLCLTQFNGPAADELENLLDYADTLTVEDVPAEGNLVQLMTAHAAKGTEYPVVFVIGCDEGTFPHWKAMTSLESTAEIEEERRLFYVAMSRAREVLYLTYPLQRTLPSGAIKRCIPSRFLSEIGEGKALTWIPGKEVA